MNHFITELAQLDMDGIFDTTSEKWGEKQASAYLRKLDRFFELLAEQPGMGVPYYNGYETLIKFPKDKTHTIFYRLCDDGIEVVRVIHSSANFSSFF